jgi:hypothetical protein
MYPGASRFEFVSQRYQGERPAIGCDGLVPGAGLDLTHWQGNQTPSAFKADTSTEIALKFVVAPESEPWSGAVVVNNHFDTDGILSAWTLLEPERALAERDLLVAAAEAGDFDEWPSEKRGLWLDSAIRALAAREAGDAAAYKAVLPQLPELVRTIDERRDLWGAEWDQLESAWSALESGHLRAERFGPVGLLVHPPGAAEAPGALLARQFLPTAWRYLLAFDQGNGQYHYRYERPRYAWAVTVVREPIPAPDEESLIASLGPDWTTTGLPGLTSIAQTLHPIPEPPDQVIERLIRLDRVAE